MLVWCPDWPIVAAEILSGIPVGAPAAVLHANRVVVCSAAARAQGVRRGLRKRDAQARCPGLLLLDHDPGRDMRAFEPVVAAVEELAAGVAILRPGVCAFAAQGPSGYYGGEEVAAEQIIEHVGAECGVEVQIGIADGSFAALLAARAGRVIEPGGTAEFLSALPVTTLDRPALTDLLQRLGIRSLGVYAELPASEVLNRFGLDAALAHRLAKGLDDRPLEVRQPPPDLEAYQQFDEPVSRVDLAAFAARALAEKLHERLSGHGLVCTRLAIIAVTLDGQELYRVWRHDGVLSAVNIADRTRWQLEGWLTQRKLATSIIALRLVPEGVLHQSGLQPGLWGEAGEQRERAHRALHRVQGNLGPGGVVMGVLGGGRNPHMQVTQIPWGDERAPRLPEGAWPGKMPAPSPAAENPAPVPVQLLGATGEQVTVDARLEMSSPPDRLVWDNSTLEVIGWNGPWPVEERWWTDSGTRAIRLQASLKDGRAVLLILTNGQWRIAAVFD